MRNYIIILLAALAFTSCDGYLEKTPVTEVNEDNFYKNYDDMYAAVISIYEPLQRNWGGGLSMYMNIASDDCYGGGGSSTDGVEGHRVDRGTTLSTDGQWETFWDNSYAGIYRANLFFEKVNGADLTEEQKNTLCGEAAFLRAYYYLDLVRTYENVPLITKTLSPSEYEQSQADPDEVYAQITSDLKAAITYLDGVTYPAEEKGRVTKYAAEALLARTYLFYTGVYNQTEMSGVTKTDVVAYLDDIINNSTHALMANYADLWHGSDEWVKNSTEGIFEVQFSSTGNGWNWWGAPSDVGNKAAVFVGPRGVDVSSDYYSAWGFSPATTQLYDSYEDTDPRRNLALLDADLELGVDTYTKGYQHTGFFNKKLAPLKRDVSVSGQEELNFPYNFIAIRHADVLLMSAELQVGTSQADDYYNQVRRRAFGPGYTAKSGVTLDEIFEERRLEFALEGLRYWDLQRQGVDVLENAVMRSSGDFPYDSGFNTDSKGFWPIPNSEIALSNQALKQNQGYN